MDWEQEYQPLSTCTLIRNYLFVQYNPVASVESGFSGSFWHSQNVEVKS